MNGEVLTLLDDKIGQLLRKKRMAQSERAILEVMQLFVIYMKDDHPKTQVMWQVFRPAMWLGSAFVLALVGVIASGKIAIIIR